MRRWICRRSTPASEEERGFPPYDPRLMVKLLVYGYATGTPSSRKLEERTHSDVAVRFLCADQTRTAGRSRVFVSVIWTRWRSCSCRRCGCAGRRGWLVWGRSALDGTKLRANASRHKAMSYERMVKKEKELEDEIAAIRERAGAAR